MLGSAFWLALQEIRRNVLRSALTVLGIVIGVAAVITMVTVGAGATARVRGEIESLGTNMLQVRSGQGRGPGGVRAEAPPFELDDVSAVSSEVAGIAAVAPLASKPVQAIVGARNWSTLASGTTADFLRVRDWPLATGRAFTHGEERSGRAVCVIGATVRRELFGAQDPLGSRIRLGAISCEVIGVLSAKGQSTFGSDQDDLVLVPLRAVQRRLLGNQNVDSIYVSARDGVSTTKVKADLERLMRERRGAAGGEDDFSVRDMQEIVSALTGTTRVLTSLLGAVAAVSLLVGGIGIMNIMLVSVTERTREIGTRLAIGALEREVLLQFLVEAVVLSGLGGLVGIALGLSAAAAAAAAMEVPFVFQPGIVAIAFLFSAAVGVVFGFFPARKAASLDPIEALRHE
jgi:putative ABC transport system permease protein